MWLPGARVHLFKLSHSRCMGVHTTIYIDNLTGDISAFVRAEEYAHMADIFWTTVAVYHDIAQENVFQHLWNFSFVVWCYNQTRTHTIIICGRRKEKGQAVVDMITQEGGEASYHFMDITDPSSIETLIADTVEKYGKIDILVNNAANVALKDGRVDELTLEMWDDIFQSDMRGTFLFISNSSCALNFLH